MPRPICVPTSNPSESICLDSNDTWYNFYSIDSFRLSSTASPSLDFCPSAFSACASSPLFLCRFIHHAVGTLFICLLVYPVVAVSSVSQ